MKQRLGNLLIRWGKALGGTQEVTFRVAVRTAQPVSVEDIHSELQRLGSAQPWRL